MAACRSILSSAFSKPPARSPLVSRAGAVIARLEPTSGAQPGEDLVFHLEFTKLESLPAPDFSEVELVELTTDDPERAGALRDYLHQQIPGPAGGELFVPAGGGRHRAGVSGDLARRAGCGWARCWPRPPGG